MIQRSYHLTETSLADHLQDLVSECTQVSSNLHTRKNTTYILRDVRKAKRRAQLPIPFAVDVQIIHEWRKFVSSSIFIYRFAIYRSLPRTFKHNCTTQLSTTISPLESNDARNASAIARFHCQLYDLLAVLGGTNIRAAIIIRREEGKLYRGSAKQGTHL